MLVNTHPTLGRAVVDKIKITCYFLKIFIDLNVITKKDLTKLTINFSKSYVINIISRYTFEFMNILS